MTPAEARLWNWLRKPGIPGLRFRRQAPIGPYIVDFSVPAEAADRRGGRRTAR
ncbi:MAG: DUF559 domain-containing protein [Bauldia sp.]